MSPAARTTLVFLAHPKAYLYLYPDGRCALAIGRSPNQSCERADDPDACRELVTLGLVDVSGEVATINDTGRWALSSDRTDPS